MKQVAFLCYINRSGSTFLARLLDEYAQIGVTPEARIPDGIAYGGFVRLESAVDVEKFLDRLYADYKFRAWGVNRDRLKTHIHMLKFPIGFDALLPVILTGYFKETVPPTLIYKCPYIRHLQAASTIFPEAKFIVLTRDLRAIYNSQKRSLDSATGRSMADNPVSLAILFNQVVAETERLKKSRRFSVVRYEDLVADTGKTLRRLLKFLDVDPQKSTSGKGYADKIVPEQKHLHPNVGSPPLHQRVEGWKHELSAQEIFVLQKVSGQALARLGYALVPVGRTRLSDRIFYGWQWARHHSRMIGRLAIAMRLILRQPDRLKDRHIDLIAPNLYRKICRLHQRRTSTRR